MIIFLVGSPLSGKTTIAKNLVKKYGYQFFSTGEYARDHGMKKEKSIGELDLSLNLNGAIRSEVLRIMSEHEDTTIIDGFPRSAEQIIDVLNIGIRFKVVYVYINPLVMHSRAKNRKRDHNDTIEIVTQRAKASQELYNTIHTMMRSKDVLFYEAQVDNMKKLEDFVCVRQSEKY